MDGGLPTTREQVSKLCPWGCTMYLHNFICSTKLCYFGCFWVPILLIFLVKKRKPLFSNPIEVKYLVTVIVYQPTPWNGFSANFKIAIW